MHPKPDPTLSLPGLQALIEQKFIAHEQKFIAQWVDRAENSRVLTTAEIDDIARKHAGEPLPSRYEYRSAERAELEYLRAALLVVQGGVQQDEKEGDTDARVDLVPKSEHGDLPRKTATGDVPSLLDVPPWYRLTSVQDYIAHIVSIADETDGGKEDAEGYCRGLVAFVKEQRESRSPDGDGHAAQGWSYRERADAAQVAPARNADAAIDRAGSEPADSLSTSTRPETGPMQFGDDWPGVFIRGDNAAGYALALQHPTDPFYSLQLHGLADLLSGCNVSNAPKVQRAILPATARPTGEHSAEDR